MFKRLASIKTAVFSILVLAFLVNGLIFVQAERIPLRQVISSVKPLTGPDRSKTGPDQAAEPAGKARETNPAATSAPRLARGFPQANSTTTANQSNTQGSAPSATSTGPDETKPTPEPPTEPEQLDPLQVPFTCQAPREDWDDPRQQDGCEEAASLMVHAWLKGYALNPRKAEQEIAAISEYEKDKYGEYRDTSIADTAQRILGGYYELDNWEVRTDIGLADIKAALDPGNLVIVPINGQSLNNPYYTAPGPPTHMIVVKGFNRQHNQFITNDPGTKRGKDYRYNQNHFFQAIRDYPTGHDEPIKKVRKSMIVVKQ